ncbi:hypothetical protein ABIF64_007251 [Bradyrhizobium japonicum]|uniref:hypothetical protein n=1 Tax=Bradyrhizobium japonicum TaxID=375 RepID=UPI0004B3977D|nr:hypothetical protein [Bradyrhizobium japonicum]MBR0734715.1 hypothetical protein [Bradyrhizobium japonicum]MBR0809628.1 hypothetical protein [Bradyrhizobium japonicum]
MALRSVVEEREPAYVSTGHLPDADTVQSLVTEAQRRFQSNRDETNSQVYPALARVPSELFGVCVVGTSGRRRGRQPVAAGRRGLARDIAGRSCRSRQA